MLQPLVGLGLGNGGVAGLVQEVGCLVVRYDRRGDLVEVFLHLACALICARKLQPL